jgi:putative PEP-CTERM system TPR-repeat lipoprotein
MRKHSMHHAVWIAVIAITLIGGCRQDTPAFLLVSAKEYIAKNDNTAAIIQLKTALQSDPNLPEARFLLGTLLLDRGELASAEKELRKALELHYPSEKVLPRLARCLILLGRYKAVTDEFGPVEIAEPQGTAELRTAIGQAQFALGDVDAARAAYAVALTAQPRYVPAQLGQARILAHAGHLGRALESTNTALTISPREHEGWLLKGDILYSIGEPEAALAAYRRAAELKPDYVNAHAAIVSLLGQERSLAEAAKQLDVMKQVAPGHPQTLYLQALVAYRQRRFSDARAAIQLLLKGAPDYIPALSLAGAIELELKSYPQSEAHLLKVLGRMPDQVLTRRILVSLYLRSGETSKALDALRPVLQKTGGDSNMLTLAGEAYMMNGQPSEAARYFSKAATLDPTDARKRTAAAFSHMAAGETDRAFRELSQAVAADSGISADLALIAAHLQRTNYDKALAAVAALERKQPGTALPHNVRGGVLLLKNDTVGARTSFERALQVDAAYFPAAANLARLDLAENKTAAAVQRFEAVLVKNPKHLQALLELAELRANSGAASLQVVALLNKAISAHPAEAAARTALIRYYLRDDTKKAVAAAQEALAVMPSEPEILDVAGSAYQAAGATAQALTNYRKLASARPHSAYPYLRMAQIQMATRETAAAMDSLQRARTIEPDLIDANRGLIALYIEAGRVHDALSIARELQKQRPQQSVGYFLEGDIHIAQKKSGEAASAYRHGLAKLGSTDLAVRLHAALAAGGGADSEQFATTWLRDHPTDRTFQLYLADSAAVKKDYSTAARLYRKLLESGPHDPLVLNNLAWVAGQLRDPQAIVYAEEANKLAPNHPTTMDTLGSLLIERGEVDRGLDLLQKASAKAPRAAAIRLNFVRALIKLGRKDAARKELDDLAKFGDQFSGQNEVKQLQQGL